MARAAEAATIGRDDRTMAARVAIKDARRSIFLTTVFDFLTELLVSGNAIEGGLAGEFVDQQKRFPF
jgi:hypothetical protein